MKKKIVIVLCLVLAVSLVSCGRTNMSKVKIDYGTSSIYSKEDMDSAIDLIKNEFSEWEGCELHSISYSSDEECNEENIAWMNDLANWQTPDSAFTQCIMFYSDFHSPKHGGGAWNANREYTDWQWWLARMDNGRWYLLTWGY